MVGQFSHEFVDSLWVQRRPNGRTVLQGSRVALIIMAGDNELRLKSQLRSLQKKSTIAHQIQQRNLANLRERKRMLLINKGFELLRNKLPIHEANSHQTVNITEDYDNQKGKQVGSAKVKKRYRLTKVDILRLTIEYIKQLSALLDNPVDMQTASVGDQDSRIKMGVQFSADCKIIRERVRRTRRPMRQYQHHHQMSIRSGPAESQAPNKSKGHLLVYWARPLTEEGRVEYGGYLLSWAKNDDNQRDQASMIDLDSNKLWMPALE